MENKKNKYAQKIKESQRVWVLTIVGSQKQELNEDAKRLEQWLNKGLHGNMQYMENYFDLRIDPTKLVPGAKSVITVLLNYFPEQTQQTATHQKFQNMLTEKITMK